MNQITTIRKTVLAAGALLGVLAAAPASAQTDGSVLAPQGASTSYVQIFSVNNLINQSGLNTPYVSGTTDFDSYVPSTGSNHGGTNVLLCNSNGQNQPNGVVDLGETITFDLGSVQPINALGFWSTHNVPQGISSFDLVADDDADFGNGTTATLGSYTASLTTVGVAYAFDRTETRYVHMVVTGHGGNDFLRAGEAVFRYAAAPAQTDGSIIQPVSATTAATQFRPISQTVDQSGLRATYTSGVTDFDSFVATTTHANSGTDWLSNTATPKLATFDLGTPTGIDAFAFWTTFISNGIEDFEIFADDDADFGNGGTTSLGSFTAAEAMVPNHEDAQAFTFARTVTQYVHVQITSVYMGTGDMGIGEFAFRYAAAPPCPADIDGDGDADPDDITAFVDAFVAGDPAADIDNDGDTDPDDINAFVAAFTAGCP